MPIPFMLVWWVDAVVRPATAPIAAPTRIPASGASGSEVVIATTMPSARPIAPAIAIFAGGLMGRSLYSPALPQ